MQIMLVLWETAALPGCDRSRQPPLPLGRGSERLSAGSFTQTTGRDSSRAARRRPVTNGCPLPTPRPRPVPPQHPSPGQALTAAL